MKTLKALVLLLVFVMSWSLRVFSERVSFSHETAVFSATHQESARQPVLLVVSPLRRPRAKSLWKSLDSLRLRKRQRELVHMHFALKTPFQQPTLLESHRQEAVLAALTPPSPSLDTDSPPPRRRA